MKSFALFAGLLYLNAVTAVPMENMEGFFDPLAPANDNDAAANIEQRSAATASEATASSSSEVTESCPSATPEQLAYLSRIPGVCIIKQGTMDQEACSLCQSELNDQYRYNTQTEQFQCSVCSPEVAQTIKKMFSPGDNCPLCVSDTTNDFALLPCGHGTFDCD